MAGITAQPLAVVMEDERAKAAATQDQPVIGGLAQYVRKCWTYARDAKIQTVETRLLQSVRARRGEYDPEKLAAIALMGGSTVYQMLTSVKCRAAGSWLRDVIAGVGEDRPWAIKPTVLPELPPEIHDAIVKKAADAIQQAQATGLQLTEAQEIELVGALKDAAEEETRKEARKRADRMADKMEEQLEAGGFRLALDQFIDDICTFPSAVIKGPVVRRKPGLKWAQGQDGQWAPTVTDQLKLEWERVSPFDIYPSPAAISVDTGYLIEKHKLSRDELDQLKGVEGYDQSSIIATLEDYGRGGLREWLTNDVMQAQAEGKSTTAIGVNIEGEIDALQFWGGVQGAWLIEWGMDEKDVPDPTKEYHVEVWLIGHRVIKATLNPDPLHRKPYYKASYEDIPGSWWGNSVADLVRDSQQVVNAAARALVNNMGMASGPQVAVDVTRLPAGETITTLTPWKIWQTTSGDGSQGSIPPVNFFQPNSNVGELMGVLEKFSELADEYSGIPRYMTGDSAGGAGRTASGLSMLVSNAGKSIKQVISNVDMNMWKPLLERLYFYNMTYADDPDLKGDINILADGAGALMAKEAAQVRRNEFLAATANPIDLQIVGLKGRGAILRETVKTLDMDPDDIVPPPEVLELQQAELKQMQKMAAQAGQQPEGAPTPAPPPRPQPQPGAGPRPQPSPTINGQMLADHSPVTDNFAPVPKPA
ncbi:MAG: portal protein [Caldimonas sp.]